jgi:hypothetical protein
VGPPPAAPSGEAVSPPGAPPSGTGPPRTHDWRAPGFAAAVGGGLYDPGCAPLRSVGANVPNLPFRGDLAPTLDWLRGHRVRWLRVFATGHNPNPGQGPPSADAAALALRRLLDGVEAFNRQRAPGEAIYVLVSLTDYYPPGVPGDRHALDHPTFRDAPVLPAPWFRAGTRQFDFDQEHGAGRLTGLPNYEVTYLPWLRRVVPALASSPALLGWQLGNELKARQSPRNGIGADQAYDWYLAFTRQAVDEIRALDRNHLIFAGAQYIGELTDWEYRPQDDLDPSRVPTYRRLVDRALGACGRYCWNVWGLTLYDFNPYPIDDATVFGQAGVAVVVTEHGFTRGLPSDAPWSSGGDRAAATRDGRARTWRDLTGDRQARQWSVPELVERTGLDGVAPWGAAAPGPGAAFDADPRRGIAGAPDEVELWAAWRQVGARLEAAVGAAGQSGACLGLDSTRG